MKNGNSPNREVATKANRINGTNMINMDTQVGRKKIGIKSVSREGPKHLHRGWRTHESKVNIKDE